MDDYIAVTEAEEKRLTDELNRNPTFVKLQAVKAVLEAYRSAAKPTPAAVSTVRASDPATRPPGPRAGSLAARLRPVVLNYLRDKGGRAQTTELLEVVRKAGIEIGGQKPSGVLSSYLSNMKEELDHRHGEGYGLRVVEEEEEEEEEEDEQSESDATPPNPKGGKPADFSHLSGGVFDETKVKPWPR